MTAIEVTTTPTPFTVDIRGPGGHPQIGFFELAYVPAVGDRIAFSEKGRVVQYVVEHREWDLDAGLVNPFVELRVSRAEDT